MSRAFDTLLLAFAGDPVERWMYPGARQYLTHFPAFLEAFAGPAAAAETVWRLGDFSGVALWLPPGTEPDGESMLSVISTSVASEKHADLYAVGEQMSLAHPTFPHWYLPWFGVDPALQGSGLGGELMMHCLRIVDRDHLPAYLETPSPRTVAFYERHGFEVTGEARAGACPPVVFMLRSAR